MQEQPPKAEHAAEEKINWLKLATKFSADGDLKGMRACAQEVDRLMAGDIDATAVNAEVALYSGRSRGTRREGTACSAAPSPCTHGFSRACGAGVSPG